MKTLLIFALAISMSLTGFADPTNELAVLSSMSFNEQKVKLTLLEGIKWARISVKDAKGKTLYLTSVKVTKKTFVPINLEALPVGNYVIRIQTKNSSIDYDVVTTAKKEIEKDYGFKANVKAIDDRFVKVSLYELHEEGMVTVKIYDENSHLLFKDIIEGSPFAKKYEFKNISTKGLYMTISVKKGLSQTYYL
jgi:hypothetical protein